VIVSCLSRASPVKGGNNFVLMEKVQSSKFEVEKFSNKNNFVSYGSSRCRICSNNKETTRAVMVESP
jgi:hypothetical protein